MRGVQSMSTDTAPARQQQEEWCRDLLPSSKDEIPPFSFTWNPLSTTSRLFETVGGNIIGLRDCDSNSLRAAVGSWDSYSLQCSFLSVDGKSRLINIATMHILQQTISLYWVEDTWCLSELLAMAHEFETDKYEKPTTTVNPQQTRDQMPKWSISREIPPNDESKACLSCCSFEPFACRKS